MTGKDKIVAAIAVAAVLIENYFVFCYFEGERGFFDLLVRGFFVHIPVGLVAWAIANNCIRDDARSKTEEDASDASSSTTIAKDEEKNLSSLQECNETKVEKIENVTDVGLLVIPSTVQTIKKESYAGCLQLKKVVLMEGVATIEDYAFNLYSAVELAG